MFSFVGSYIMDFCESSTGAASVVASPTLPDIPIGIKNLAEVDRLFVRLDRTRGAGRTYSFSSPGGDVLFTTSTEQLLEYSVGCGGQYHGFYMHLLNAFKQQVISLRRPKTFGTVKVQVRTAGVLTSIVRQDAAFTKPILLINDAHDKPVLRIKGPINFKGVCDFDLLTLTKQPIGGIARMDPKSNIQGLLEGPESYRIYFPKDLDLKYKVAVLGATILIDFICLEGL